VRTPTRWSSTPTAADAGGGARPQAAGDGWASSIGGIVVGVDRDRYEMLDVIGSGGMATVWRARDTVLGRLVAIKRPNPAPEGSIATARFSREARAAATVAHPNLVAVHDAGVDATGPYLVMELIDGPSLATASIAADRVARIGHEAASALAALHAAGVVHGDVKPANILIARDGAKLTDFGIARAADDTATLSLPGVTFATPAYAPPETVSHGERSAAGDVYSLAVTLYELLTGARWNTTVGSTQVIPPAEWARVLTPALSPHPSDRPSAAAFAASLAELDTHRDQAAPTTPMPMHPAGIGSGASSTSGDAANSWRTAVGVFVAGALLIALIGALALRDGDDVTGADSPGATLAPTAGAVPTATQSTTPATTATTAPTLTTAPTTAAPTTAAPTAPAPTASALAAELVALIGDVPRDELKPKEANDISKRIEDVVRVASRDPSETDKKLREAAEQVGKRLSNSDTRARAEELLIELANALGIPESTVADAFEHAD
jgi:eukaryotic-like serine/threonine-protein kinase